MPIAAQAAIPRQLLATGMKQTQIKRHRKQYAAKFAGKRSLFQHSVLLEEARRTNSAGHVWNVSIRRVHPAAAMRSLTSRKLVVDGCVRIVVTHRVLAVAEQDLIEVTRKTIQSKRIPLGIVPVAAQAAMPRLLLATAMKQTKKLQVPMAMQLQKDRHRRSKSSPWIPR